MMGLPVVATRVGGIPEIIENDKTGLLIEPDEPEILKEAILKIISNKEKQNKMIIESYNILQKQFDIKISVKYIELIYINLCKART